MFQFKSIELMNWDFWPHFQLPFDERIIMLAGPNGSGKTTFLDSLRLLLGAKTLSTGRKLSKYLRSGDKVAMVKGIVTNQLRHGKRPFHTLGYATDEVTLVCMLDNRGGTWEKKFAILPDNADAETIKGWDKWYGPEEYGRTLHTAGLPRTLLKILALEQGETNKLCQKSPQELLKYLLEIQGDKQTLDRYSDALENYRASEKELFVQAQKALGMERNVLDHEKQATEAATFHARVAEFEKLKAEILPKAIYKDIKERSQELQQDIGVEESKLGAIRETLGSVDDRFAQLLADDQAALAETGAIRETSRRLAREKEKFDLEYGGIARDLEALQKLREDVADIQPEDGQVLAATLEEKQKASARLAVQFDEAHESVLQLIGESRELENQKGIVFPREVTEVRQALDDAHIKHSIIAEMVEIREPEWQTAVESALSGARFALVVEPKDSLRSREIARLKKYKYFITEYETRPHKLDVPAGSALAVTDLARNDLPEWIIETLARVQLVEDVAEGMKLGRAVTTMTRDGYKQDVRGGVYTGVDRLYCGRSAAGERLRVISTIELPAATARRDQIMREREAVDRLVTECAHRLTRQRKLAEWREREAQLNFKTERRDELIRIRREMTEKIVENESNLTKHETGRTERAQRRGELNAQRERLQQEKLSLESALPAQRARAMAELEQLRRMEAELPEAMRTAEAMADVPSREVAESLLQRLDEEITTWSGCRDLSAKEVYEKIKAEYDEFDLFLKVRKNEHARWADELGLARRSYRRVVDQTVEFYRRAVVRLAEKAGFQIEVPNLDLTDDDEALEHAKLIVRVAYDGKHFVNIDDPDLSGGQSVLTSLVLLLGMTFADGTDDSTGFFILDEPFAHLSVERIDDVAAFLAATKSQFILTTPTTHNHNVFNPSHLTVALRKKKPGEVAAPAPVFIRR
jgi:chromosome segregation ATPase